MVSVASLLNHVPSETAVQRIQLPPSPMSTSSSHCIDTTSSPTTSASTSPITNASSSNLNRLVHSSSLQQANGHISGHTSASNTPSHSNNLSNTSNPGLVIKKQKMSKDGAVFVAGKIKGDVNFPPYEDLDELTIAEVLKFHVYPLGKITKYCRHIPYNSEKKTFLEKTGRESFEVFQYVFRVPDDDKDYTVMWDYNTGLVRITPFFKCCKFTKTTPAKMLNLNPGLKDITHSITGGALVAQGYWMPYACALAVCATFCHHIAAALIPIFGPSFPSRCVVPEAPEHGRFSIDPAIVVESAKEAERYRMLYSSSSSHSHHSSHRGGGETRMLSPRSTPISDMRVSDEVRDREMMDRGRERERERENRARCRDYEQSLTREMRTPGPNAYLGKRLRLNKRAFGDAESPHASGSTDTDAEYTSESSNDRYLCSPFTPASEKSVITSGGGPGLDHPYVPTVTPPRQFHADSPSPYLTAVPGERSPYLYTPQHSHPTHSHSHSTNTNTNHTFQQQHHTTTLTEFQQFQQFQRNREHAQHQLEERERVRSQWRPKRRIAEILDRGNDVDDGYDGEHEESASSGSGSDKGVGFNTILARGASGSGDDGQETKAARLLMNLSVQDRAAQGNVGGGGGGDRVVLGIGAGLGMRIGGGGVLPAIGGGDGSADMDAPRVKRMKATSM